MIARIISWFIGLAVFLQMFTPAFSGKDSTSVVAKSYKLKVRILTDDFPFEGEAAVSLRNVGNDTLRTLIFYLHPELDVQSIRNENGTALKFDSEVVLFYLNYTQTAKALKVLLHSGLEPGKSRELKFIYKGWFNPSYVRSRNDGNFHISEELIFLRGYAYTLWFPVLHSGWEGLRAEAQFHLELDIPSNLRPVAFGRLLSEVVKEGRNHSVWETYRPIDIIWPQILAGPWQISGTHEFRVYHYASPEDYKAAQVYVKIGTSLKHFFDKHYGQDLLKSPFFVAEMDVPSGGIGSINAVGLSTHGFTEVLDQDRYYPVLEWFGHEMVHKYVVPSIVPDAPGVAVLLESFPCFFHLPALTEILGHNFVRWALRQEWKEYQRGLESGSNQQAELPPDKPLANITLDELPYYKDRFLISDKALIILHHLKENVGEDVFYRAVAKFLRAHRTTPATLEDFRVTLSKEAGRSLESFFHRWFETTEHLPREWQEQDESSN